MAYMALNSSFGRGKKSTDTALFKIKLSLHELGNVFEILQTGKPLKT